MKSVLYIFFIIGHTYTDMYIYLYKIHLAEDGMFEGKIKLEAPKK